MNETELLLKIQRRCYRGLKNCQGYIDDKQDPEFYRGQQSGYLTILKEFIPYFGERSSSDGEDWG